MAGNSDNKPTHRVIAKRTDSRNDRYETVGVAWRKVNDDGREVTSIKLNPFINGHSLITAASVLLVPNDDGGPAGKRRGDDFGGDDGGSWPDDDNGPARG